eukprot:53421-Prymnesium_polylepis.1
MGAGTGRLMCVHSTARGPAVSVARPRATRAPSACHIPSTRNTHVPRPCSPLTHTHTRPRIKRDGTNEIHHAEVRHGITSEHTYNPTNMPAKLCLHFKRIQRNASRLVVFRLRARLCAR